MKVFSLNIILIIIFMFSLKLFPQSEVTYNFTPPSPEAAEIVKYGNLEINESTGKAAVSVPLYTYKAGQIEVPITLNYVGNGVKLNAPNTWTGVNWLLSAGGVITRTVHDLVDEEGNSQRMLQTDIDALGLIDGLSEINDSPANNASVLHQYFNSGNWDTQPDIFNFSFPAGQGSFYLDENYNPVLINSNTPMQIKILGYSNDNKINLRETKEFKIITADGVSYYFGGSAVETSTMKYGDHNVLQPTANTGYYLNRIVHPINGIVYFEYSDNINYRVNVDIINSSQVYLTMFASGGGPPPQLLELLDPQGFSPSYAPALINNDVHNAKFLRKISSNNGALWEVNFNTSKPSNAGWNFEEVLESIEVINNDNKKIHKIDFSYLFDDNDTSNIERFFLEKIDFNNGLDSNNISDNQYKKYEFVYEDPLSLPKRFSYAQDHFGYYNGAVNNIGLLPSTNILEFNGLSHNANRTFSFANSQKGTLKKVIYPTGGSTNFEYEYDLKKKNTYESHNFRVSRNSFPIDESGATLNDVLTNSVSIGSLNPTNTIGVFGDDGNLLTYTNPPNTLLQSQDIDLNIYFSSLGNFDHQTDKPVLTIHNITDNVSENINILFGYGSNYTLNYHNTYTRFFDKDKQYTISLNLNNNVNGPAMTGTLVFKFVNGLEKVNGGGIRVKRVYDQTKSNDTVNVKRYYYMGIENVLNDPLWGISYFEEPSHVRRTNLLYKRQVGHGGLPGGIPEFSGSVDQHPGGILEIFPTNHSENVINTFEKVSISYGGDAFEEGGVEKVFYMNSGNVIYPFKEPRLKTKAYDAMLKTHSSASWLFFNQGKLLKETILSKKTDTIYKVRESRNILTNNSISSFYGFVGSFFSDYGPGFIMPYSNVGLGRYEIWSREIVIDSIITTDYIDPFPVAYVADITNPYLYEGWMEQDHDNDRIINRHDDDYHALIDSYGIINESDYRKIITKTNYKYDSEFLGLPTNIETTTSIEDEIKETRLYYVDETDNLVNLPSDELANYQTLRDGNRVGTPIQTETYLKRNNVSNKLSTNRTLYSDEFGDVLPAVIQESKGNNDLENRIIIIEYDSRGNPLLVKMKDGSITKYVYNELDLVTRKIENFIGINPNPDNSGTDCQIWNSIYLDAMVTSYAYHPITHKIIQITDSRCNTVYYEYDTQHRLKYIRDKDNNILSKTEYNYQTQN